MMNENEKLLLKVKVGGVTDASRRLYKNHIDKNNNRPYYHLCLKTNMEGLQKNNNMIHSHAK